MTKLRIGIVGCGNISGIYFQNLSRYEQTEIVLCSDLDLERARAACGKYGVGRAVTTEELLRSDEIDLVLNLTVPKAHAEVAAAAVFAGKHVYNEKPLTIRREDGRALLDSAKTKGVRVGCAPDTFLGGGHQTCRKLIEDGVIGEVVAAEAFMVCHGHESWHPSPEFYYEVGGGPMFDMGPYYLTALVNMIGGMRSVSGMTRTTFPTRTITSEPKKGTVIDVKTPTHIIGAIEFENGALGQITTSFDCWRTNHHPIHVHGSEGSMLVPDPNGFGGSVWVFVPRDEQVEKVIRRFDAKLEDDGWLSIPLTHGFAENSRGIGVLDMAHAIAENRPHRASGELAYHVLDAMHGFLEASDSKRHVALTSSVTQPTAVAEGEFGQLAAH